MSSNPNHIPSSLHWLKVLKRIEYKVISTTYKLLQSSPHYLRDLVTAFVIHSIIYIGHSPPTTSSLQSQDHNTNRSFRHLASGTNFLLLFVFLISLVHHHHAALLHRQALIMDRLLAFLVALSILLLKFLFLKSFHHSHLSVAQVQLEFDQSVFGSHWRSM